MLSTAIFIALGFESVQGTPSDVAQFMSESLKMSSLVVLPNYDKITYDNASRSLDELVLPLKKDDFAGQQTTASMLYKVGLPKSKLGVLLNLVEATPNSPKLTGQPVQIPATAIVDDALTFKTAKNEVVTLSSLLSLPFKRKIEISAYFNGDGAFEFPIGMNVTALDGAEFAKILGRGLGAKVLFDPKKITLAFDAPTFRNIFSKVIVAARDGVNKDRKPGGALAAPQNQEFDSQGEYSDGRPTRGGPSAVSKPSLLAALNLLQTSVGQMTDTTLEQTFAYSGTDMTLDMLRYPAISQAVVAYFQTLPVESPQPGAVSGVQGGRGRRGSINSSILNRVNARDPGKVTISTDFKVRLELNLAGPQGRPGGGKINVQIL